MMHIGLYWDCAASNTNAHTNDRRRLRFLNQRRHENQKETIGLCQKDVSDRFFSPSSIPPIFDDLE
jgi:hypothetical protein